MDRDKFNLIWRYLHLADNDAPATEGDKLSKIRWFVDFLNEQFQSVYVPYGRYTVDESMVKFKGDLNFAILAYYVKQVGSQGMGVGGE